MLICIEILTNYRQNLQGFRFHHLRREDTICVFDPPMFGQRITGHKTISILPGRRASALTS
jgi:hypothetical protein